MSERLKILGTFALLGFVGGIVANFTYKVVIPWLVSVLPLLAQLGGEWILSGLAGALLTMAILVLWVYLTEATKQA